MRSRCLGVVFLILASCSDNGENGDSSDLAGGEAGESGTRGASGGGGADPVGLAGSSNVLAGGGSAGTPSSSAGGGSGGTSSNGGSGGLRNDAGSAGGVGVAGGGGRALADAGVSGVCGNTPGGSGAEGRAVACVSTHQCTRPKPVYDPQGTAPTFQTGNMKPLIPPFGTIASSAGGVVSTAFDPSHTATLYAGVETQIGGSPTNGLWQSKDGGASWTRLGSGADANPYDCKTDYLDLPVDIQVDPFDSNHMYVTEGVRGAANGFWVTWDGGKSWIRARNGDLTTMAVDPCDFCHVLVGSHETTPVGVLESFDGGSTWKVHPPPAGGGWPGGTYGLSFLDNPATNQGDEKTWLVHNNAAWRTTDAGDTWKKVSSIAGIHGSTHIYYASDGTIYSGAEGYPMRSKDNGQTWEQKTDGLAFSIYTALIGDGKQLYAMPDGYPPGQPLMTSGETDGTKWVPYGDGKQNAPRGFYQLHYDTVAGILYYVAGTGPFGIRLQAPASK